ncbi:MAG: hypothetical protein IJX76_02860 [Clostridia bacterium]|nr:hypothetical protein [Clostridia bacterium]
MSFSLPAADASVARFESIQSIPPATPSDNTPVRLLWGRDPYLRSRLLSAIAGEAANRRRAVSSVYDPLLSDRLVALSVEGMGHFTLDSRALNGTEELIDCNLPLSQDGASALIEAEELTERRRAVASEIGSIGRAIADNKRLLATVAEKIADYHALRSRAERIARRIPRGDGEEVTLPIACRGEDGKTVLRLPFSSDTRVIGLQGIYRLDSLFLTALADAVRERGCRRVILTNALTDEVVGVRLPSCGLCYLADAPSDRRDRQLSLRRYLLPHTTEQRRAWRNLALAVGALEGHLDRRLAEYRTIAKEEEALRSSLYSESRLQSFRKRLLIDLFCS